MFLVLGGHAQVRQRHRAAFLTRELASSEEWGLHRAVLAEIQVIGRRNHVKGTSYTCPPEDAASGRALGGARVRQRTHPPHEESTGDGGSLLRLIVAAVFVPTWHSTQMGAQSAGVMHNPEEKRFGQQRCIPTQNGCRWCALSGCGGCFRYVSGGSLLAGASFPRVM